MTNEEITETPDETQPAAPSERPSGRSRWLDVGSKKLKILILLAMVMVGEAGAMYFFVPAHAPSKPGSGGDGEAAEDDIVNEAPTNTVEVAIDSFNVTNSAAAPGSIIHITFKLVAIVSKEHQHTFDQSANKAHHARVRQAIVKVARSASLDDLNDPNLTTVKRLMREEINKVLRKSYVNEVVISDFKTMEQ